MSETRRPTEKLLTTRRTGEMLGGLHPRDVCRLIRSGMLPAKQFKNRGRGGKPRYRVLESAVQKFIVELPDAFPVDAAKRLIAKDPPVRFKTGKLSDVIEFV